MNTKLTISISILTQLLFAGLKTAAVNQPIKFNIYKVAQKIAFKTPLRAQPLINTTFTSETLFLHRVIFSTFNP